MKKTSETIVFFGSGPVAAQSLQFLVDHFIIETVVTKAVPAHHKYLAPVEKVAKAKKLKLLFASTKGELDQLIDQQTFQSRVGVIVDYGVIVSEHVIKTFPLGIVNSHFSLLPQWRGADPITFSILSGQTKTGVSLMVIEPRLDTGKLITQKSLLIQADDTTPALTSRLISLSNQLLATYLPQYILGKITLRNQPHPDRATYSRKLTKNDGLIDWGKTASQIEREIRAYIEWPKSRTVLAGQEIIITKAHVIPDSSNHNPGEVKVTNDTKDLLITTGEGILCIDRLKPAGKADMSTSAFLAGYGNRLHMF